MSSGRFEKARGGKGRGQGLEHRACSDWPGATCPFLAQTRATSILGSAAAFNSLPALDLFFASGFNFQLLGNCSANVFDSSLGPARIMTFKKNQDGM